MNEGDPFNDATTIAHAITLPKRMTFSFSLIVEGGPDQGLRAVVSTDQPAPTLVGKSPGCDLVLKDPSMSRRHVSLEVVESRLRVRDLGSTNGTRVNGLSIVEAYVCGGEGIEIGGTVLRIARDAPAATPELPVVMGFGRMLGKSDAIRRLYPLCQRLAQAQIPVVIEGETGTGKEQLAEAMHAAGPRASAGFLVLDCTAITPSLIETELFGHERGAFTGSVGGHEGVFERANGGTLFIDEIGDLPMALQSKLLRAIERLQVTRVGGRNPIDLDVRVLAATRRDLDAMVQRGEFRDDLYHRLAVARIQLPPLRERHGDIAYLAGHFWQQLGGGLGGLPAALLARWVRDPWPGNVRELRNAVARVIAVGDLTDLLPPASVPPELPSAARADAAQRTRSDAIAMVLARDLPLADARQVIVSNFEQRYLDHLLEQNGGNVTRAAAAAGIARRSFQRLRARNRPDR